MGKIVEMSLIVTLTSLVLASSTGCTNSLKSISALPNRGTIAVSSPQQITVTAIDTKGNKNNVTTNSTYQSSDDKIVAVSADGSVEGKSAGYATITVFYTEGKVTRTSLVDITVVYSRGEGQSLRW
jgi:hypothetical protein